MIKTNLASQLPSSASLASATNDLRAIKDPVALPNPWLWLWIGLGILALLGLAGWRWRRSRRPAPALPQPAPIPPHEKALRKLREALGLMQQPQPFCILVSDTIRAYLEERFRLRAPERTTEEFLEELQASALLSFEQKQTLGDFLMRCDLVKFARYEPGPPELQCIYDAAVRLIEETHAPPLVATAEMPAAAAPPAV